MTFWQPVSGCGPRCRAGGDEMIAGVRVGLRIAAVVAVVLLGLVVVPVWRRGGMRFVARTLLIALGVRLRRRGRASRAGSLLVANHVSWLDIVALLAMEPVSLVAKREVHDWPGIGALAALTGGIFVDRARPKALPGTVAEVTAALRAGRTVAVFPEGTTQCGGSRCALSFRPAMFQAALNAGAPVVPIAITYDSTAAAFIGDETLWVSVRRVAALRSLSVTVTGSPALHPVPGADRRTLARAAQAAVGVRPHLLSLAAWTSGESPGSQKTFSRHAGIAQSLGERWSHGHSDPVQAE
jgi:1-acyl-sn-glycerol-3-phosphate acyltransferase